MKQEKKHQNYLNHIMNKINNTEFEDKILILFDGVCSLCNVLIKILDRIPNNNKIIMQWNLQQACKY